MFGKHRRHRSSFGGAGASEEVALAAEETLGNLKAAAGLTQAIGAKGYRAPEMLVPALQVWWNDAGFVAAFLWLHFVSMLTPLFC